MLSHLPLELKNVNIYLLPISNWKPILVSVMVLITNFSSNWTFNLIQAGQKLCFLWKLMSVPLLSNDCKWVFIDSVIHWPKIARVINVGSWYIKGLTLLLKTRIPCIHSLTPASSPLQPPFNNFNTLTKIVDQFNDDIFLKLYLMLAVVQ